MKIIFNDDTYGNNIVFHGIDKVADDKLLGYPGYYLFRGDFPVCFLFSYEWSLFSVCTDEEDHFELGGALNDF